MLEVMKIQDVVEELVENRIGNYADSFNHILILHKEKEDILKSYQICVQKKHNEKDLYICEYDLFSGEVGKTYDIKNFKAYAENCEVYVISEVEKV